MDSLKSTPRGCTFKRGKVRESHMEQLILDPIPDDADDDVKAAFSELIAPDGPAQQIGAVEKLSVAAVKSDRCVKLCINIFMSSLLQLPCKAQLRMKILKVMKIIANANPETYENYARELLCSALLNKGNPLRMMQAVNLVVEDGSSLLPPHVEGQQDVDGEERNTIYMEMHPFMLQGILNGVTQLWNKYNEAVSSVEATQILQLMQQLVKNSTAYLQQCSSEVKSSSEMRLLLDQVVCVIGHASCPLDLRINCGQLMAMVHKLCSENGLDNLVQEVVSQDGQYVNLSPLAQLAVINGVMCVSTCTELFGIASGSGRYLGIEVMEAILSSAFQSSDGSMAISNIRMVQHWTLRTVEVSKLPDLSEDVSNLLHPKSHLMSGVLDYLWLSWDHFLDSVKHATKDSFQNLIKTGFSLHPEDSKEHYTDLCKTFLSHSLQMKYKLSAVSSLVQIVGCQALLTYDPQLPRKLLTSMKDSSMASHAAELLEALFTVHVHEVSQSEWNDTWLPVFLDSFSQEMQRFGYELLFKKLLLTSPESLDHVVSALSEAAEKLESKKLCLLIMCVKIGRQSVYWLKKCQEINADRAAIMWKFILPYKTIMLCLKHIDESVQTAAFSLLCESPKSTEVPEKQELDLILDYYHYNITNESPSYKQHMVKSTKKLLFRIKESVRIFLKAKNPDESMLKSLSNLSDFCQRLFLMMMENLHVGANNARRGTSLVILELIIEILSLDYGCHVGLEELCSSQTYVDTLLYILDDSYESNKVIALKLLQFIPEEKLMKQDDRKINCLVDSACNLASSCRPPDSLTASYIFRFLLRNPGALKIILQKLSSDSNCKNPHEVFVKYLLESLKKEVKVAQISLIKAAASGPMYGLLLCLRALLSDIPNDAFENNLHTWKPVIKEVLDLCYLVSDLVAPVVRNSSPEGHLPMDLDPESLANLKAVLQASLGNQQFESDVQLTVESKPDEIVKAQAVSAQMLLLCAWRSVKEISLILGDIFQRYPLNACNSPVLTVDEVRAIGQYFLTQLSETKHRGAFEQSYLGFSRICERLWQCSDEQLHTLPEEWLTEVMNAVQNDEDDRLCPTRRSAGVPFIIQAILSSEPNIKGAACLKSTMTTLLELASEDKFVGLDARIHSFNILRALYRDTRLGDSIVPYAPAGVQAAIRGYNSDSWSERNSASLLFASLVTRMFGVKKMQDDLHRKNAMSALVFFRRYPELYEFLKLELENGVNGVKDGKLVPALFPVLLLLARLSPSPVEGHRSVLSISAFAPSVICCTSSSVFQLRSLASHALIPLITPDSVSDVISQLCKQVSPVNQNSLHGCLLCLLKIFQCFRDSIFGNDKTSSIIGCVMGISWTATEANRCLLTRSCALELYQTLLDENLTDEFFQLSIINSSALTFVKSKNSGNIHEPWAPYCLKVASHYILCYVEKTDSDINEVICELLSHSQYEVCLLCLNYVCHLESIHLSVFLKLVDMIQSEGVYYECYIQGYHVLNKHISHVLNEDASFAAEKGIQLLKYCTEKAIEETCMELLVEIITFCSMLVEFSILKLNPSQLEEYLNPWMEMMIGFSGSENDLDVRIEVANGVSRILAHNLLSVLRGRIVLEIYETLVILLQDDSELVRNIVASNVEKYLDHEGLIGAVQPTRVLEIVCDIIARINSPQSLSLLAKLVLKEDIPEGFGLAQDEDRVFDKGEMNGYQEGRSIAQAAVKSFAYALQHCVDSECSPTFIKKEIIPYLHINPEMQIKGESQNISLITCMELLAESIHNTYEFISSLETVALYCVKNVEIWLVKLASYAALWKVLNQHCCQEFEAVKSVVLSLEKSAMRGKYLLEIIGELS